jgi:hypothetical protein
LIKSRFWPPQLRVQVGAPPVQARPLIARPGYYNRRLIPDTDDDRDDLAMRDRLDHNYRHRAPSRNAWFGAPLEALN